jgi:hypothetical protein
VLRLRFFAIANAADAESGLPDGLFSDQKLEFEYILESLAI